MPEVLITVRHKDCERIVGKYCDDGTWKLEGRGRCACDPRPALPTGAELERLTVQAKRKPRPRLPGDGRLVIRVRG